MSFRRMPFQFTTTDPVDRQRELERRFGLPASGNMFVDVPNPLITGAVPRESSASSSSPRLQHRVPIFGDGHDQPLHSSVDSIGSYPENKKPKVRVIPIQIEGAESRPARHRTFSGPAARDDSSERRFADGNEAPQLKHSMPDLSRPSKIRNMSGPRVHNIPIQVEGGKGTVDANLENVKKSPKIDSKINGCTVTKPLKSPGKENKVKVNSEDPQKLGIETSLKKIENVLEELKTYEAEIQEFSGSIKDKKYRYLDEMLTRCMIKLDDVDTMGNANVRTARKNAVKKVQAQIDLLESKVNVDNALQTTSVNESQAVTSDIKNASVGEISSDTSDQQNEVACESLENEDQATKDENQPTVNDEIIKYESQLDTEMTKSETDEQINKDIEKQLDAEMKECAAEIKSISENIENQHNSEITENVIDLSVTNNAEPENQHDAEMVEKLSSEAESASAVISENQATTEQSSNVHEVEMTEISDPLVAQDTSLKHHEIEEVEMIEKDAEIKTDLPNEDHLECGNEQVMNSKDVEMSDIQSTFDHTKEQVPKEITIESAPSQFKENESDRNLKKTDVNIVEASSNVVPQNEKCEDNLTTGNRLLVSDINNADDSLKNN